MNLAQLIYNLPIEDKRKIRTLEKLRKKEINTRYSELFNKTCLNENLLPTYTNIYIYIYIFKPHIYFSLCLMALIEIYKFSAKAKHLSVKCLPILNGRSANLTNLVIRTLLYIDSEFFVARSIDVPKFSADCR